MKPTTRDSVFSALDNQPYRRVFLENGNWMGTLCLCALISSHCTADCIFTHSFHLFFPIAVETKSSNAIINFAWLFYHVMPPICRKIFLLIYVSVSNSKSLSILNIFFKSLVIESCVKVYDKIRVDKCVIAAKIVVAFWLSKFYR